MTIRRHRAKAATLDRLPNDADPAPRLTSAFLAIVFLLTALALLAR